MASKFWVGGTGNWSDSGHWTTPSSGGVPNTTKPGAADIATFDAASGAGTVTIDEAITCQSIVCGAHTGTINFGANNVTLTGTGTAWFNGSGSGARTLNAGTGVWTISGAAGNFSLWTMAVITGLTNPLTAFASCTIALTNTSTLCTNFNGGGCTYGTVTFNGHANKGGYLIAQTNIFTTMNATGPNLIAFPNGVTTTITNPVTGTGSSGNYIELTSNSFVTIATIAVPSVNLSWGILRGITITGAGPHNAVNTIDMGGNTGWETLTPPSGGGAYFSGFAG